MMWRGLVLGVLAVTVFMEDSRASVGSLARFNSVLGANSVEVLAGKRLDKEAYVRDGDYYKLELRQKVIAPSTDDILAVYVPYMGGMSRIIINSRPVYQSLNEDKSIEGTLVPLYDLRGGEDLDIHFIFRCVQTTFCGLWRGVPEIGGLQLLSKKRESEVNQENVIPLVGAALLLITAITVLLLSFGLRKEKRTNIFLALFLFSWSVFFLSYGGYLRMRSGFWAGIFHFPIRSVTALGLLLFIDSYFASKTPRRLIRGMLGFGSIAILVQCYFGYIGDSINTLKISSLMNLLAFMPIFLVVLKSLNPLKKFSLAFGCLALVGQLRDSAMLFGGGTLFNSTTMYINKYTLPPFVMFAFADHLHNYVILTLKDRLLKTQSKLLSFFSIRAGKILSKSELDFKFTFFYLALVDI